MTDVSRREKGPHATAAADHRTLARYARDLREAARRRRGHEIARQGARLANALREHLAAEDDYVLPIFERIHASEAHAIAANHALVRTKLDELAGLLVGGAACESCVAELASLLERSASEEERTLYPWLERRLALDVWNPLRKHFVRGWPDDAAESAGPALE